MYTIRKPATSLSNQVLRSPNLTHRLSTIQQSNLLKFARCLPANRNKVCARNVTDVILHRAAWFSKVKLLVLSQRSQLVSLVHSLHFVPSTLEELRRVSLLLLNSKRSTTVSSRS